jgi:hypothetical protein
VNWIVIKTHPNSLTVVSIIFKIFTENILLIRAAIFEDNKHLRETFALRPNTIKAINNGNSPIKGGIACRVIELFKYHLQPNKPTDDSNLIVQKKILQQLV